MKKQNIKLDLLLIPNQENISWCLKITSLLIYGIEAVSLLMNWEWNRCIRDYKLVATIS